MQINTLIEAWLYCGNPLRLEADLSGRGGFGCRGGDGVVMRRRGVGFGGVVHQRSPAHRHTAASCRLRGDETG